MRGTPHMLRTVRYHPPGNLFKSTLVNSCAYSTKSRILIIIIIIASSPALCFSLKSSTLEPEREAVRRMVNFLVISTALVRALERCRGLCYCVEVLLPAAAVVGGRPTTTSK